jgi:hypothetical protein
MSLEVSGQITVSTRSIKEMTVANILSSNGRGLQAHSKLAQKSKTIVL